jgi:hypothetical protein
MSILRSFNQCLVNGHSEDDATNNVFDIIDEEYDRGSDQELQEFLNNTDEYVTVLVRAVDQGKFLVIKAMLELSEQHFEPHIQFILNRARISVNSSPEMIQWLESFDMFDDLSVPVLVRQNGSYNESHHNESLHHDEDEEVKVI